MGESARQEFNDTGVRVTLIEPGMVDTPFFDDGAPPDALQADDVARAVMFAVSQPPHVDVNEILVRPTASRDNDEVAELHAGLPTARDAVPAGRYSAADGACAAARAARTRRCVGRDRDHAAAAAAGELDGARRAA